MRCGAALAAGLLLACVSQARARQGEVGRPPLRGSEQADEQPAKPEPKPAEEPREGSGPADLLKEADAALDQGDLQQARVRYQRIVQEHPDSPEAGAARRALKIMEAIGGQRKPPAPVPDERIEPKEIPEAEDDTFYRLEPYSIRTSERLRLTWWEKLDFGVTSFIYGMSVGFSYSLAFDSQDASTFTGPIVVGAGVYTGLSIAYLYAADPDRGDLPLALAVASYVPTTVALIANINPDWGDERSMGLAIGLSGTLAIPVAALAAHYLSPDPGDTQLIRDAGFWGLALGTLGTLAFASKRECHDGYCDEKLVSGDKVAIGGLVGLYGCLGLGVLAASQTEISLERVRATTWGGYGGMITGALIGSMGESSVDVFRGMTIGGAAGLVLTFMLTPMIDVIPEDTRMVDDTKTAVYTSIMPIMDSRGKHGIAWGLRIITP